MIFSVKLLLSIVWKNNKWKEFVTKKRTIFLICLLIHWKNFIFYVCNFICHLPFFSKPKQQGLKKRKDYYFIEFVCENVVMFYSLRHQWRQTEMCYVIWQFHNGSVALTLQQTNKHSIMTMRYSSIFNESIGVSEINSNIIYYFGVCCCYGSSLFVSLSAWFFISFVDELSPKVHSLVSIHINTVRRIDSLKERNVSIHSVIMYFWKKMEIRIVKWNSFRLCIRFRKTNRGNFFNSLKIDKV